MRYIGFDVETVPFRPGRMAPQLVVVSWAEGDKSGLVKVEDSEPLLRSWLEDDNVTLVAHNASFDASVCAEQWQEHIPLWFSKYQKRLVACTLIQSQLVDIACGKFRWEQLPDGSWVERRYGLSDVHGRLFGQFLEKDVWRLRYGELLNVSLSAWPQGARDYSILDAVASLRIFSRYGNSVQDLFNQSRCDFALKLCSTWGVRTGQSAVSKLRSQLLSERGKLELILREARLLRANGSKNVKAIRARVQAAGGTRQTGTGALAIDAEACESLDDETLKIYAQWSTLGSSINKDIPMLMSGSVYPIHTSFGLAASGRTTSSKPNCQNWGRNGGVRGCFVPRDGRLFAAVDFPGLELRTVAQVLLEQVGWSKLGDRINSGEDPHLAVAATMSSREYEHCVQMYKSDDAEISLLRQFGKAANFGFPGGMSAKTLQATANASPDLRRKKIHMSLSQAQLLRDAWFTAYPEFHEYFRYVRSLQRRDGLYDVQHLYSKRWRRGIRYTEACNTLFQGLGADVAKHALWLVTRAAFTKLDSPLYNSRVVLFVHDEIVSEVPEDSAVAAANELSRIMTLAANKLLTKVPLKTEPVLMRQYGKYSKPKLNEKGELIPW